MVLEAQILCKIKWCRLPLELKATRQLFIQFRGEQTSNVPTNFKKSKPTFLWPWTILPLLNLLNNFSSISKLPPNLLQKAYQLYLRAYSGFHSLSTLWKFNFFHSILYIVNFDASLYLFTTEYIYDIAPSCEGKMLQHLISISFLLVSMLNQSRL